MTGITNEQRIIAMLRDRPGLDDDELSEATGVSPRQQVNQICRRLESLDLVHRETNARGKIVNFLKDSDTEHSNEHVSTRSDPLEHCPTPNSRAVPFGFKFDPRSTLFIFSCSGSKKKEQGGQTRGPSILDELPPLLSQRLAEARTRIKRQASIDETTLIPAWQRYSGSLYQAAQDTIEKASQTGIHMIIVSGGYGLVLAAEPIGYYEAVFRNSWWPKCLLEEVLFEYMRRHRLRTVCAVASATTEYAKLLRRVNWKSVEPENVTLLTPEETTGAMVKSPRAQGEALSMLLRGGLDTTWASSDGLRLNTTRLL